MERRKELYDKFCEIMKNHKFVMKDIVFHNSYFVFTFDEYSIIHFTVKGLKKWLFGLWMIQEDDGKRYFQLFAQPLNDIDKFKPSRAQLLYRSYRPIEDMEDWQIKEAMKEVVYPIKYDRRLAWYIHRWDCFPINNIEKWKEYVKFKCYNFWLNFTGDVPYGYTVATYSSIHTKPYVGKGLVLWIKSKVDKDFIVRWDVL